MKKGFTLIEMLIVVAILVILMIISVGALNPATIFNRAHDAQRKRDLGKIKVSFEEYFNDKNCYPNQAMVNSLNCGTDFPGYLNSWPCDPDGTMYKVFVENSDCPKYFRVYANLKYKDDPDIPPNWNIITSPGVGLGDGSLPRTDVNYGVSSPNVSWKDTTVVPECLNQQSQCFVAPLTGGCNSVPNGQTYTNAYTDPSCTPLCFVECCDHGNVCN